MSEKPDGDRMWANAQVDLSRVVYVAWSSELAKDPGDYNRDQTEEEMVRWTRAAREKLITAIDKQLENAVKQHARPKQKTK
jgi:hypothetical protein